MIQQSTPLRLPEITGQVPLLGPAPRYVMHEARLENR
jgi:hypothetical protein